MFSAQEQKMSSTSRELIAVKCCLQSFAAQIQHEAIELKTDHVNASHNILKGRKRKHFHSLAIQIFEICIQNDILLKTTWIPREVNKYYLSKLTDTDDRTIESETFICAELGHDPFCIIQYLLIRA